MTEQPNYRTIARDCRGELEVSRSRFLAVLARVETEDAARAVIAGQRAAYPEARHHCSAFVLGPDARVQRSNDDGEPSGTAGAPMLAALRGGAGLTDVVAVVTRWFGGTLLGTGGLARAYAGAVEAAIEGVTPVIRRQRTLLDVPLSHAQAGKVEAELRTRGIEVLDTDYTGSGVTLHLAVAEPAAADALLAALTGGAARAHRVGTVWRDTRETSADARAAED
ncbi:IMPACT family protein [Flexivirga meconopsidis]|uniref:IMPACT family protein n=1 Tax=Flexivirga meconopsidis TaxID=2977121 RepID=UPI002240A427|nr:YigZ family protein [Flexivirga meconopsidis]